MRRSTSGFLVVAGLVLFAALSAYVAFELVQRNRYAEQERRMFEALGDFRNRARVVMTEKFDVDLAPAGVAPTGSFKDISVPDPRYSPWTLTLMLPQPELQVNFFRGVWVRKLNYRRHWILEAPRFQVVWEQMHPTNALLRLFDGVMKEHQVDYEFEWVEK